MSRWFTWHRRLQGVLLVLVLGKRRRRGRVGLIWWSVTAVLSGALVLLAGWGMDMALQDAANPQAAQFVAALQSTVGGAFTLYGLLNIALAALLIGLYLLTKPRRRRAHGGAPHPAA